MLVGLAACVGGLASADVKASLGGNSWHVLREFPQSAFPQTVPAGNYSGVTHLHDDVYGVVSDKSDSASYFNFQIQINHDTGEIEQVRNLGVGGWVDGYERLADGRGVAHERGFDHEAIAKVSDSTLVIASEGKCRLKEYAMGHDAVVRDGMSGDARGLGGLWQWSMPAADFYPNYVFESLAYDSLRHTLWTVSESVLRRDGAPASPRNPVPNKLRLLAFDSSPGASLPSAPTRCYAYRMDEPTARKDAQVYVMGVSELCALPDGQLLVLEREAFVPKMKIGAFCHCKLYVVDPSASAPIPMGEPLSARTPFVGKTLLTEWKTTLTLLGRSFANYEGMCLGPQLADGSQVLILLSDSQDQYAGVLKDYFKTIVITK